MPRELYVYFKAPARQADAVQAAVMEMQSRLRSEVPGLQARLLRRDKAADAVDTWMETYALPDGGAAGVTDTLGATIEQRAIAWSALRDGPRHIEVFDACA